MLLAHSATLSITADGPQLLTRLGWPRRLAPAVVQPPGHLAALAVGGMPMTLCRECSVTGADVEFALVRACERPACFHITGFLSEAECERLARAADERSSMQATTLGGTVTGAWRRGCDVAWLPVRGGEGTASAIATSCERLLLSPEAQGAGRFENLQVLRYNEGGEYQPHYDANERTQRVLTVLFYLNGVGRTWFPLASAEATARNPPRLAALAAAPWLVPARDGLTVTPSAGDAVAFYNYQPAGRGGGVALDRLALHAGLPAPSERRVAALWFRGHALRYHKEI